MQTGNGQCDHAGTVWRIHVIGLEGLHEPGTWECTRCGDQWDQHPVISRIRQMS